MTRHTLTNVIFGIALLSLILLGIYHPVRFGWYILLFLLYTFVIALGSYFIQLQFFTSSYCNSDTQKPYIAITFDDGPDSERTTEILNILKAEKATATFFCIGKNIAGQDHILKRIDTEGHLIGTHSYNHRWNFSLQKKDLIAKEITQSQEIISNVIHKRPLLFRPPFGVTDPPLASAIKKAKVHSIGWSVRSYDTVISTPGKLLKRVSNIKKGDIILFHDAGLQTNVVLPLFIKYVRSKGFEIVPLDQLLGIPAYEI